MRNGILEIRGDKTKIRQKENLRPRKKMKNLIRNTSLNIFPSLKYSEITYKHLRNKKKTMLSFREPKIREKKRIKIFPNIWQHSFLRGVWEREKSYFYLLFWDTYGRTNVDGDVPRHQLRRKVQVQGVQDLPSVGKHS